MLTGEKNESPGEDQPWQLVLHLRENVSLICAPAISSNQTAYLSELIDEYFYSGSNLYLINNSAEASLCQPLSRAHNRTTHSFVDIKI